jgi:hypothetical protein
VPLQILFPGLLVLLKHPFEIMAVPALIFTFLVTVIGIHRTPDAWLGCHCSASRKQLAVAVKVFTKISIMFVVYTVRPLPPSLFFMAACLCRHRVLHISTESYVINVPSFLILDISFKLLILWLFLALEECIDCDQRACGRCFLVTFCPCML